VAGPVGDVVSGTGVDRRAVTFATRLEEHGNRVAVIDQRGTAWSYADLVRRADEVTARLGTERRLVAVVADADVTALAGYLGALRGGHPVLLLPAGDAGARARLLEAYEPDVVIDDGDEPGVPDVRGRPGASLHALHPDLALLLSTSGSTGSPKLVRLSHDNVQANADAIAAYLRLTPADRAAMSLPLHYCYGLSVVHSHLAVGASVVMAGGSVVDRCFWDRFEAHGCTSFAGVPHTFELLEHSGFEELSLPTLRYVTQAGGRLAPDRVERLAAHAERGGWELFVMYGQTEATARMAYLPPDLARARPGSIGRAVPGGSFRLEPVDGAAPGVGELVYRGPNVMLGYAERRADLALGRQVDELHTGDLARIAPDGLVEIVGRTSRFAKLFGVRVDFDQVEQLLADEGLAAFCTGTDEHLAVAVTGIVAADEVARSLAHDLHLPLGAARVVHVDELPRLSSGKPDHRQVLELVGDAEPTPPRPSSATDVDDERPAVRDERRGARRSVAQVFAEVLDVGVVRPDDTFVSLGGDSLSYVEASVLLEDVLGDLPAGWHTMPVEQLERGQGRRCRLGSVEGNVVLRALAIVTVVGTHASLYYLQGGAHLLLAVAGYNFARFRLTAHEVVDRLKRSSASIARIAVPALLWVWFMFTWREPFSVPRALLVDNVAGDGLWRYWYVEVLLQLLVVLTVAFSLRAVRDLERRWPFALALVALGIGLVLRFAQPYGSPDEPMYRTDTVAWIFLLGWAIQRARTVPQRLLLSAVTVVGTIGFFDAFDRGRYVALGILALVWIPRVRLPRAAGRLVAALAGASLYIFLTHYATLPLLRHHVPAWALLLTALAVGVAVDAVAQRVRPRQALARWRARRSGYAVALSSAADPSPPAPAAGVSLAPGASVRSAGSGASGLDSANRVPSRSGASVGG
jgi:acyl-CoA synthetase (AMP-forming)/AMP-acid ligase II